MFLHFTKALSYAAQGFRTAFKTEIAFTVEIIVLFAMSIALCFISIAPVYKLWLWSSGCLVPLVELLNTAIEKTVDRISTDVHPLSKQIKDLSAAAVCLSIVHAFVVLIFVGWVAM